MRWEEPAHVDQGQMTLLTLAAKDMDMDMIFFLSLSFARYIRVKGTFCHFWHDIIVSGQYGRRGSVWLYGIWYDKFRIPFDVRSYLLHTRSKINMMRDVSLSPPRLIRYLPISIGWTDRWQSSKLKELPLPLLSLPPSFLCHRDQDIKSSRTACHTSDLPPPHTTPPSPSFSSFFTPLCRVLCGTRARSTNTLFRLD